MATNEPQAQEQRKVFIPLENNPEVMTQFAHALGLPSTFSFHDIYSLDASLLDSDPTIPRPIHALIFIFPVTPANETFFRAEESTLPPTSTTLPTPKANPSSSSEILWLPQTIINACGLLALTYTLVNNPTITDTIPPSTPLHDLITATRSTPPAARGALLSSSPVIETLHAHHARLGSSAPPADPANWHDAQGFVAFVTDADGRLWELEGRRKGPVDRGFVESDAEPDAEDGGKTKARVRDMLDPRVLERTVGRYLEREREAGNHADIRFSLIGLAGGPPSEED